MSADNPALGFRRDGVSAVEYARDRRLGNSGSRGHFAHGVAHGKRPLPDIGTLPARETQNGGAARRLPSGRAIEPLAKTMKAVSETDYTHLNLQRIGGKGNGQSTFLAGTTGAAKEARKNT